MFEFKIKVFLYQFINIVKIYLMSVLIYKKQNQAKGEFNNGEILENKPIGFSQDGGDLKALFKFILLG